MKRWSAKLAVIALQGWLCASVAAGVPPGVVMLEGQAAVVQGTDQNGNGVVESGGEVAIRIPYGNSALSAHRASEVRARLSVLTATVELRDDTAEYGLLEIGQTREPVDGGFRVFVPAGLAGEVRVQVRLSYTDEARQTPSLLPEPLDYRFAVEVPPNHAPSLTPRQVELDEDTVMPQAVDLWAAAADPETPSAGLGFRLLAVSAPEAGVSLTGNRYLAVAPQPNWFGTSEVTLEVSDPQGLTDQDMFRILVRPINDPPVTVLEIGTPQRGGSPVYVSGTTPLRLRVTDDSAAAWGEYQLDGGPWVRVDGPFQLAGDGPHLFTYRGVDQEGAVEFARTMALFVDATPPTTQLRRSGSAYVLRTSDGSGVGVAAAYLSTNGGTPTVVTGPFELLISIREVSYWSVDLLGNSEAAQRYVVPRSPDLVVDTITTPHATPLICLRGSSTTRPLVLGLMDPSGQRTDLTLPVTNSGSFSHQMTVSAGAGTYLITAGSPDFIPIEVVVQIPVGSPDASVPLTVADIMGHGSMEIVAAFTDGQIHVWNETGSRFSNWPQSLGLRLGSPVLVADVDAEPFSELVGIAADGRIRSWNWDGSQRWTRSLAAPGPFVAGLVGYGPARPGRWLVIGAGDGRLFGLDGATGQPLAGWPARVHTSPVVGLAVADLNGDGTEEVVAAAGNRISALLANGQMLGEWRVSIRGQVTAGPIIGQMRPADVRPSVLAAAGNRLFMWAGDGTRLAQAAIAKGEVVDTLALGDVDGDRQLDVLGTTQTGSVMVWEDDLSARPGWPVRAPQREPLGGLRVLSLAGSRTALIASAQAGRWVAWGPDGDESPTPSEPAWTILQAPVLSDVDADGDMEWVTLASLNGQTHVYVWDDPRQIRQPMVGWPQAGRDPRRTSSHAVVDLEPLGPPERVIPLISSDVVSEP